MTKSTAVKRELEKAVKKEVIKSVEHVKGEARKAVAQVLDEPRKIFETFLKSLGI